MKEAKEKKFDIILVKDFTRIARNAELTQQFIKFLEATNIKLITLNDVKASASSTKMRVAVYGRVSPGHDIHAQIQLLKNHVNEKNWEFYDIYTDEKSGFDSNSTGIQRLINDAQENKFDVIVTKEFSRLTRSNAFLYELMNANQIQIITLDEHKNHKLN